MARAQQGDRAAYEAFLKTAANLVRAFVRWRLHDPEDAEDVVQDVLLALHRYRHTYDPGRPVAPWLYAIARHRLVDATKKRRRRTKTELLQGMHADEVGQLEALFPARPPAEPLLRERLTRALELLSAAQREVIRLLKIEGYSVAEIAQKTDRSPSAVKVTAHRGYKTLRRILGEPLRDN